MTFSFLFLPLPDPSSSSSRRFFQQRHSGHYRIINLCSERNYSLNTFHGSVARYPFPDHNPPPMELILPCCSHMHSWLQVPGPLPLLVCCAMSGD